MTEVNNLQLELKRHCLNLEFIRMIDLDSQSNSQEGSVSNAEQLKEQKSFIDLNLPDTNINGQENKLQNHSVKSLFNSNRESGSPDKHHLDLEDTEHPDLKIGLQKNGRKYSVRTNRKRFFFPNELNKFVDALETDNQRIDFDVLINTGARYNEAKNIKKEDIDFERGTLTIKVAKIKAKKGQKFPDPRTFKLSSQFLSRLKEYTKDLNDNDTLPFLTNSALNLAVKKIAKRIGIKDFYMMSVHNIRKTHGQYLVALNVNIANICKRLGHDMNTFLGSYCSADIFNDNDRILIKEILGDLV